MDVLRARKRKYEESSSSSDSDESSDEASYNGVHLKKISRRDVQFQLPFAAMICGSQMSGKTTFLEKCIKNVDYIFHPHPRQIVYCFSEINSSVPKMQKMGVTTHQGIPTDEELNRWKKPLLLILDDLMLHVDKKYLDLLFTVKSHHKNIGVIFVTQNTFHPALKTARDNCTYLIFMSSPSSLRQIRDIGANLFPHKSKEFMEVYQKCTSIIYGYFIINLHAATPGECRLYRSIFPGEYIHCYEL